MTTRSLKKSERSYLGEGIFEDGEKSICIEDAVAKRHSVKALLVHSPHLPGSGDHWVPHGHIRDNSDVFKVGPGQHGVLVVSRWIALEKGWIARE